MKVTLRKKNLNGGRVSLYLDIYHLGKRRYEYLNIYLEKGDKERKGKTSLAESIRAKRELEVANNYYGFVPDFKKKTSLINYFENFVQSHHSNSIYHNSLRHLKLFAKEDVAFQEIDEKWISNYKKYLLANVSQNTASSYFSILKHIFKLAKREKLIRQNITEDVSNIKYADIKREFLELDEVRKLIKTDCTRPEISRAFLFSCFTGLRYSDVKKLKWENVKGDKIEIRQLKTKEIVHIPLSKTAKQIIFNGDTKVFQLPETYVFDLPQRHWANEVLKKWFKKAGINKNGHFHMSRHTFATLNLTADADLYTVSKLLGHKEIRTTQIYAKIIDSKKQEAIDNLPEIEVNL